MRILIIFLMFAINIDIALAAQAGQIVFVEGDGYLIPPETNANNKKIDKSVENDLQISSCREGDLIWFNFDGFSILKSANDEYSRLKLMKEQFQVGNVGCASKLSTQEVMYYSNQNPPQEINIYNNNEVHQAPMYVPRYRNCTTIGGITNCVTY